MSDTTPPSSENEFQAGAQEKRTTLLHEFWGFLRHTKKWWLTPIIILIFLLGPLVIGGGTVPFIYTLS